MPDLWTIVILGGTLVAATELLLVERHRRLFRSHRSRLAATSAASGAADQGVPANRHVWRAARAVIARQLSALAARTVVAPADHPVDADGNPFANHAVHHVLHAMRSKSPPARNGAATSEPAPSNPVGAPPAPADSGNREPHAALIELTDVVAPSTDSPTAPSDVEGPGETDATRPLSPAAPVGEAIVYVDASGRLTFANRVARLLLHWNTGGMALSDLLAGGPEESAALLESVARQELVRLPMTLLAGGAPVRAEINALALRDRNGGLWGAALFIRRTH